MYPCVPNISLKDVYVLPRVYIPTDAKPLPALKRLRQSLYLPSMEHPPCYLRASGYTVPAQQQLPPAWVLAHSVVRGSTERTQLCSALSQVYYPCQHAGRVYPHNVRSVGALGVYRYSRHLSTIRRKPVKRKYHYVHWTYGSSRSLCISGTRRPRLRTKSLNTYRPQA